MRRRRNEPHALLAIALICACSDAPPSDTAPPPLPAAPTRETPLASSASAAPADASARSSARAADSAIPDAGCTFDWIELSEAMRMCPVFGGVPIAWTPIVRTIPKELSVASGGTLRFTIRLGSDVQGAWTADLDDRCGIALKPVLLDAREQPLENAAHKFPPLCPPGRARVTLSGRGAVSAPISLKAARGEGKDEQALAPGAYFIELQLPTSDGQVVKLPLTVTRPP